MKTSNFDSLRAATSADDILQCLANLASESGKMKLKSQPFLSVIELYKWMPDNQEVFVTYGDNFKFEQTPFHAIVDRNTGDSHFCFETFRLLRDCYDAGGYIVTYTPPGSLDITEPTDLASLRWQYPPWPRHGTESYTTETSPDEDDDSQIPLPPLPEDILSRLSSLLRPLTREKFERDSTRLKEEMPTKNIVGLETVSDDTLRAIAVQSMQEQIVQIHRFWLNCQDKKTGLTHPLLAIVYACLCHQDAKHITREYDKHRPVAILKREAMGSIRDVVYTRDEGGTGSVRSDFIAPAPPKEKQLKFWPTDDSDTKLPEILPFEMYQQGLATTKSAAVAMPVRLAFEALLQMEPGTHTERLHWQLGDLIDCLNPDGKFNWTNQVDYILNGLSSLYWLRFPYKPKGEGEVNWIPFLPRAVPNQNSTRDSRIIVEVSLPLDLNTHGMMVEKTVVRLMGKKSSARFNAYLTACWIFDNYGTIKGRIIDPTAPAGRLNDRGEVLNLNGELIHNSRGKPVTSLKSSAAARQLGREANSARDRYPILNNADLTRSCYPKGVPTDQQREYLKRAKKAWTQLEEDGFVRIERFDTGWRIMPSEQHVTLYHALKRKR